MVQQQKWWRVVADFEEKVDSNNLSSKGLSVSNHFYVKFLVCAFTL